MLLHYKSTDKFDDFDKSNLKDYSRFIEIIKSFQRFYGLEKYSLREIDIFLWLAGKEWFPKKYKWGLLASVSILQQMSFSHEHYVKFALQSKMNRKAFIYLWDSINEAPKPCYSGKSGKKIITHYESYPWDDIQETREYNGKPWHVIGNPWVFAIGFSVAEIIDTKSPIGVWVQVLCWGPWILQ